MGVLERFVASGLDGAEVAVELGFVGDKDGVVAAVASGGMRHRRCGGAGACILSDPPVRIGVAAGDVEAAADCGAVADRVGSSPGWLGMPWIKMLPPMVLSCSSIDSGATAWMLPSMVAPCLFSPTPLPSPAVTEPPGLTKTLPVTWVPERSQPASSGTTALVGAGQGARHSVSAACAVEWDKSHSHEAATRAKRMRKVFSSEVAISHRRGHPPAPALWSCGTRPIAVGSRRIGRDTHHHRRWAPDRRPGAEAEQKLAPWRSITASTVAGCPWLQTTTAGHVTSASTSAFQSALIARHASSVIVRRQ